MTSARTGYTVIGSPPLGLSAGRPRLSGHSHFAAIELEGGDVGRAFGQCGVELGAHPGPVVAQPLELLLVLVGVPAQPASQARPRVTAAPCRAEAMMYRSCCDSDLPDGVKQRAVGSGVMGLLDSMDGNTKEGGRARGVG